MGHGLGWASVALMEHTGVTGHEDPYCMCGSPPRWRSPSCCLQPTGCHLIRRVRYARCDGSATIETRTNPVQMAFNA